jgi:cobalt-zinc-cadmium efflux system membrane fusion protein
VNIGKYVNPNEVLFELANPANIHLALTVFEKDINKLAVGQNLLAYTNTNPQKKYPLKIILISKNLSNQNAAEVHCRFVQYDQTLLPGMVVNAEIELATNKVVALPEEAIVRFENKHYIFVSKHAKQFEMKEVEIGNSENGFTEIINLGHINNEIYVTKGAYTLLMALKNTGEE